MIDPEEVEQEQEEQPAYDHEDGYFMSCGHWDLSIHAVMVGNRELCAECAYLAQSPMPEQQEELILCPDGAEITREEFNEGQH